MKSCRHSSSTPAAFDVGRRRFLTLGAALMLGKTMSACSSDTTPAKSDAGSGGTGGVGGPDAASGAATGTGAGTSTGGASTVDAGSWATGGTASMTAKTSYPNPFTSLSSTCTASCELTQGPCYSSQSEEIQDISYGYDGLPMRMYLRILDDACKPVENALVDVWHVGPTGKYSGNDSANEQIAFCTGNDSDFTSHVYFRGKQKTDKNGVVYFDTCFPGWYASRTVHIHMTISVDDKAYVTTQLGFDDTLDDAIIATQPIYKDRGKRDTLNSTDTVLPADGVSEYLFETERMTDGAMLAFKTLFIRSSLTDSICSPAGAGGQPGGGPGGPGGEGGPPGGPGGGPPPGFPMRDG
jgi:protocatechuate 3,4-dioxygenase beta subunit